MFAKLAAILSALGIAAVLTASAYSRTKTDPPATPLDVAVTSAPIVGTQFSAVVTLDGPTDVPTTLAIGASGTALIGVPSTITVPPYQVEAEFQAYAATSGEFEITATEVQFGESVTSETYSTID